MDRPHKKLEVWQRSLRFAKSIYDLTKKFPDEEKFGLTSQMRRAAVSVLSNISEGAARNSSKEKIQFFFIAQGSVSELDSQLELSLELNYITSEEKNQIFNELEIIGKLLSGLIRSKRLQVLAFALLVSLPFTIHHSPFTIHHSLFADGKQLYEQKCAQCHGMEGKGDGEAAPFVDPKPRDFTTGSYKIRTTPSGQMPTDSDLEKIIAKGIPGTSMTAFDGVLSKKEIREVIHYLKTFSPQFADAKPEPVKVGSAPRKSKALIEKGKELYQQYRCFECHGQGGRGDGPSAPTLKNEKGEKIHAADLTKPWTFRGGSELKDIFMRLTTGLSGTPMPSYAGIQSDEKEDEKARWALAHYIQSLSEGHPNFKSVITAKFYDGDIPFSLEEPAKKIWEEAEEVDIPLVGQVIEDPRLFIPAIDLVTVAGVYNQKELFLKVRWSDRTKAEKQGAADFLSVQLPMEAGKGDELPYFLFGNERQPVQRLTWLSGFDKILSNVYKGLSASEKSDRPVEAKASYDQGEWTVLFRFPLDNASETIFAPGKFIPIAFSAGDGSNNETEKSCSISSWVHLLLKQEPSRMRFVWPPIVFVGVLGGEMMLLKWLRKRRKII